MSEKRAVKAVDLAARSLSRAGDDQLLELAAAGNSRAFEAIVERYRPALLRFCGSLTSAERVDDAVQQAFVSAWLAIDRGVLVRDLRPWLYRIAHHAAVDQHRARGLGDGELSDGIVGGGDPALLSAGRSYFEEVLRAVSELPERQRVALLETAVHGRSTDSVAHDLGVSGGALRQLVHRARVTVRTTVTSLGAGPLATWLPQVGSDDGGLRRLATVLGGAGTGAVAALSKTSIAVVSAGAIAAGGIVSSAEHGSAGITSRDSAGGSAQGARSTASAAHTSGASSDVTASATVAAPAPQSSAGTAAGSAAPAASTARKPSVAARAVATPASLKTSTARASKPDAGDRDHAATTRGAGSDAPRGASSTREAGAAKPTTHQVDSDVNRGTGASRPVRASLRRTRSDTGGDCSTNMAAPATNASTAAATSEPAAPAPTSDTAAPAPTSDTAAPAATGNTAPAATPHTAVPAATGDSAPPASGDHGVGPASGESAST